MDFTEQTCVKNGGANVSSLLAWMYHTQEPHRELHPWTNTVLIGDRH
ncbi:hypothetical protein [Allocoleopsis sp.]